MYMELSDIAFGSGRFARSIGLLDFVGCREKKRRKSDVLRKDKDFKMAGRKIVTWDGHASMDQRSYPLVTAPLIFIMELPAVIAFPLLICALTSTHAYATNLKI